jgi:hypothetical protein
MSIPYRNEIIHDTNASQYPSPYELTDKSLSKGYYDVPRDRFGTTEVIRTDGTSFVVKDYQYKLPDGNVGMYFIPVNDFGSITTADNNTVDGHELIDAFLIDQMGLKAEDRIYAFVNYFHPEQNKGTIEELLAGPNSDKIELGFTHLGAYYGRGYTTNAPMLYHSHKFGVTGEANQTKFGYPANVQIVSLEGVAQNVLNSNFFYVDTCLNAGVMFPNESPEAYKDSKFRPVDINTALMFYRDWLNYETYLRRDNTWYTYCAAHKTIVATIALNLPHNPDSFKEVYGEEEGADLWEKFILFYNNVIGPDPGFLDQDQTNFEPLWKLEGFTSSQISPFSVKEYYAYEKAFLENNLKNYKGKIPLSPNQAMCWAPQTAAEIVLDIIQIYADMLDVGSIMSSATILGFMPQIEERMGISKMTYLLHAMPIVDQLMIADAKINAANDPDNYLKTTFQELYIAFGGTSGKSVSYDEAKKQLDGFGKLKSIIEGYISGKLLPDAIAAWALLGVVLNWDSIIQGGTISPEDAYVDMMNSIQKDLESAEDIKITEPDKVQYNTPPAITHSIGIGLYKTNKYVSIKEVCTVIDISETQIKPN